MKKLVLRAAIAAGVLGVGAVGAMSSGGSIVTVVKLSGIPWFDRMDQGVKKYAADTGTDAVQVGPAKGDVQLQIQLLEDTIAKKPAALAVVPLSPEAVEPVLKKAQDLGIKVVTHEASSIQNASYDIEAFANDAYGEHLMQAMAKCMGEEGQYTVFVGNLTSKTHNEWVDAAIAYQKQHYPKMEMVGSKNESNDDQQKSYDKALEVLRAYPNIKGFQGSSSLDVPGIGRAVEERGLQDSVCVVGTGLPSQTAQYLETGAIKQISFWDPADAGYVMNKVAALLLEGKTVESGQDLGVAGYNSIVLDGKVIYGQAWVDVNKDNMNDYPF